MMSSDNIASKPATPRCTTPLQALSGLFRTPTRLRTPTAVSHRNKRTRARTSSLSSIPSTPNTPSLPAVVLQTYSVSTDSIVLTALPSVPFCCHEDLLTMSRPQLEGVVRALNARLPRRMRICSEDDFWRSNGQDLTEESDDSDDGLSRMSEAEMRRRIEELVGIRAVVGKNRVPRSGLGLGSRAGVPPAPKAVRTRDVEWRPYEKGPWEMEVDSSDDQTDDSSIMIEDALLGSSPLASRTRSGLHSRGRSGTLPRLAILQEENEGNESKEDDSEDSEIRPSKKQRVSSGSASQNSEGGSQIVHEVRESRLIENMDQSGSPLLAEEDALSDNLAESDATAVTTAINSADGVKTSKEDVPAPLQRRRSVRIQEIALKRASPVDTSKKTTFGAKGLNPTILHSRNSSSRCSSRDEPTAIWESDAGRDAGMPKEFTIRLPFTSTPPHQKSKSPAWSAPHILRSYSQRLANSSQATNAKASLGRSKSERYPRTSDLAFVTINRPRYRFTRRKSKGTKVAKGGQERHPSTSGSPAHAASQPQRDMQIGTEDPNENHESEKENKDPKTAIRSPAMGGLHTLPSALCSFLAPRSRAPSTSTVASILANSSDSPARTTVREGAATATMVNDGTAEHVWEALGRMVVGSL